MLMLLFGLICIEGLVSNFFVTCVVWFELVSPLVIREDILNVNLNLRYIFQKPGILTDCRTNNFREMIGCNNILNNEVIHRKTTIKSP